MSTVDQAYIMESAPTKNAVPMSSWADWTACHLPGGPVGPPSRWAATSNVEVEIGQTTYPVNRGRVVKEERECSYGRNHKEKDMEGGSGTGEWYT